MLCVLVSPLRNHCEQGEAKEHCCSTWLSHLFDITWMPSTTSGPAIVSFGTGMGFAPRKSMVHFFDHIPWCVFQSFWRLSCPELYVSTIHELHKRVCTSSQTRHHLISICFHSARAYWNNNYTVTLSGLCNHVYDPSTSPSLLIYFFDYLNEINRRWPTRRRWPRPSWRIIFIKALDLPRSPPFTASNKRSNDFCCSWS